MLYRWRADNNDSSCGDMQCISWGPNMIAILILSRKTRLVIIKAQKSIETRTILTDGLCLPLISSIKKKNICLLHILLYSRYWHNLLLCVLFYIFLSSCNDRFYMCVEVYAYNTYCNDENHDTYSISLWKFSFWYIPTSISHLYRWV